MLCRDIEIEPKEGQLGLTGVDGLNGPCSVICLLTATVWNNLLQKLFPVVIEFLCLLTDVYYFYSSVANVFL